MLTPSPQEIETAIHTCICQLLAERGELAPRLEPSTRLNAELGLSSMDLALLVVEIEATLGLDPFASLVPVTSVRSVGDVVAAYRLAASGARAPDDQGLSAAADRGLKRRGRRVQT
jgi:acyl carrier protein